MKCPGFFFFDEAARKGKFFFCLFWNPYECLLFWTNRVDFKSWILHFSSVQYQKRSISVSFASYEDHRTCPSVNQGKRFPLPLVCTFAVQWSCHLSNYHFFKNIIPLKVCSKSGLTRTGKLKFALLPLKQEGIKKWNSLTVPGQARWRDEPSGFWKAKEWLLFNRLRGKEI